jgi:hypothetical protein
MGLRVAITDLYGPAASTAQGGIVAQPTHYTDCQVEIPYANDARTARVTISSYDEAAAWVRPLDRFLKVWYIYKNATGHRQSRVIFWGPITVPEWNTEQATVTINAHDPSLRIKHSYINHSDIGLLDPGTRGSGTQATGRATVDATGMRLLCYSAEEQTASFPLLGVSDGYNTAHPAPLMNDDQPRFMVVTRGDESWQRMQDLARDPLAPDFEIEPWDRHLFGDDPGTYARMNLWRKEDHGMTPALWSDQRIAYKGFPDKRGQCVFQYGFGADNLESLTYSPGGDRVLNYFVAVTEHEDDALPTHRQIRQDYSSRVQYGTYMGWKAVGADKAKETVSPADLLAGQAIYYTGAYGTPPEFVTFTPKPDTAQNSRIYIRDWWPGDTVTVQAKQGYLTFSADVLITKATVKQADDAGNTQIEIEAVPSIPGSLDDPGDDA